ncbi:hypothetical protein [Streptomyces sp. NPDC101166]|uniref:hypothetical protein n=2 Tax=Actinomycetes TaxID=1760 RepID=UPI00380659F3
MVSHDAPDYPVMNLQAAQRGLTVHQGCGESCDARRYFQGLVPRLETIAKEIESMRGRSSWNIW